MPFTKGNTQRPPRQPKLPASIPHEFAEDDNWSKLAHKLGVRLPQRATAIATGPMESWLKKLGISNPDYLAYTGGQNKKQFIAANPHWTLRAWVGLLLEAIDAGMIQQNRKEAAA